eukprot:jgi/Ulvmu1/7650/UM038_0079.1
MSRTAGLKHLLPRAFGIVGAGQLGTGVADLAARHGFERIIVHDVNENALIKARENLTRSLRRAVASGKSDKELVTASLSRLEFVSRLDALETADFVVEAVHEDESLKKDVFRQLDRICQPSAILSSNTSSISITRLAAATARPENVIGMHFMNPPVITDMLEIVGGKATSAAVYERAQVLALHLNKTVCFSADRPGFIVNRILMPMINEAFFALMEGVASAEDIDLAMKKGTHQHMGPLHLADYIGLDTCLNIMRVLHSGLGEDKYRPCPMLVQLVDAGWLGVKAGRGVFLYPDGKHTSAVSPGVSPPGL